MPDLLFEIGTEELPSWYVKGGGEALVALINERLVAARLTPGEVVGYATPRRLAVWVKGIPAATPRRVEERRGPPAAVAYDAAGGHTR